ncbi:Metallo-hydrolase/oxidoreductase [Trichoderma citrinoviride]|uniref:Metallo-hydrolase/oxidoreductase n=1 Tax=Trichoderma citrinoviride TaxID=58853 RepID=A0A2T4AZL6_9HYPO|nr:Metallo-hydrolase/oxidoreductase [Trichoderma citrinoviride]PTB62510.1 Metallo-hydrolase/oxidoreductase [Trichoderma citrinoviride]
MAAALVALPVVQQLSPRCIRILGGNPGKFSLQGTNTYLLGSGHSRILIDTGEGRPAWIQALKETLTDEKATVKLALITHWHHDHTGGIADLVNAFPQVKIFKNSPDAGQLPIQNGDAFEVEDATLTACHTPGHTKDHMVFVLTEEDAMFAGDNVLGQGTAVFEDLATYIQSLKEMKTLFSGRLYPGHGPVVDNGPEKIAEYIEHRRQREEEVLRAMRGGAPDSNSNDNNKETWTAMEIVKVVYKDVREDLHMAACGGVVQMLAKLEQDGKVRQTEDGWQLQDAKSVI